MSATPDHDPVPAADPPLGAGHRVGAVFRPAHTVTCTDAWCDPGPPACPSLPRLRFRPGTGMVEREIDGRWFVLDAVGEADHGAPLVDVVDYAPTLPAAVTA